MLKERSERLYGKYRTRRLALVAWGEMEAGIPQYTDGSLQSAGY